MQPNAALTGDNEPASNDLGPLAWVLDELRKSLDGATKALRRFVRDAELARGSDLAALDASQLRIARQQLHQAVGALEMVGMAEPAKVLRAMESLAQKFVQRPEFCSDEAANKVERASFALTEYLEGVLKGKQSSSVALFPQYRDVLELVGDDRIHPADLWPFEWRWLDVTLPAPATPLTYDSSVRARIDGYVLKVVKSGDVEAAQAMRDISLGFAAAQSALEPRVFWKICAAYFEAVSLRLCPTDVYGKRAASRILLAYRTLARGEEGISERLVLDLLFFCAQAVLKPGIEAPVLAAVRATYGLTQTQPFDYETPQFGRFDPALLVQARKRIAAATETWSGLAGGDTNRLKVAVDQFGLITDSILKLHPESGDLAHELTRAIEATARSGEAPAPSLAMEVATVVLFLEAAYEDLDPTDSHMAARSTSLAKRLARINSGGQTEPLEPWMEELYRRVSDRQIMGSVVGELRTTLGVVEASLDTFFRNPLDKVPLHEVPSQLSQMRGVFSVLGLDQAALASLRMRSSVEKFLTDDLDIEAARTGIFEKLGNSLGALGFLIDMLSYQRELAKKLFIYDEVQGEFKPLMGRQKSHEEAPIAEPVEKTPQATTPAEAAAPPALEPAAEVTPEANALVNDLVIEIPPTASLPSEIPSVAVLPVEEAPAPAPIPAPAPVIPTPPVVKAAAVALEDDDDDRELKDIFLEEAREVIQAGLGAIRTLATDPADLSQQTTLRRAFHTLKGSARMVGLHEFGEAGWAMEQLLNSWLAEQKPASEALLNLTDQAMHGFGRWVEAIDRSDDADWQAQPFRQAADALRLNDKVVDLVLPAEHETALPEVAVSAEPEAPEVVPELATPSMVSEETLTPELMDFYFTDAATEVAPPEVAEVASDEALTEFPEIAQADEINQLDDIEDAENKVTEVEVEPAQELLPEVTPPEATEIAPNEALTEFPAIAQADEINQLDDVEDAENKVTEVEVEPAQELLPEPEEDADYPIIDFADSQSDDQVKVIGSLRIDLPLYNVYLNEADEWSRRLLTEVNEWALELPRPVFESTAALAHALSGSSATVGFRALSEMSRALEQALQHVRLHRQAHPEHAQVFIAAAEDIRRLLHQFAAGFLKDPNYPLIKTLKNISATEFPFVSAPDEEDAYREPLPASENQTDVAPDQADASAMDESLEVEDAQAVEDVEYVEDKKVEVEKVLEVDKVEDILDVDLFPIFVEEALELLPKMGGALRQWTARPDNLSARNELLRVLHTLKGSARLAGAMHLGNMAHHMESAIEKMGQEDFTAAQLAPLGAQLDAIQANFDQLRATPEQALSLPEASPATHENRDGSLTSEIPMALPLVAQRQVSHQSVRVRSQLLDRLVNQAGEVMMTRSRLESRVAQLRGSLGELTGNLDRLRGQLRDMELQSESQMQSRLGQAKDADQEFDPLEFDRFTRVQELTRMMAESVNDVATVHRNLQRTVEGAEDDLIAQSRQTHDLQHDLLRTRMVEFEGIVERLHGVVRQAAKEAGKQVALEVQGGSLDMDRGVLDRMTPVFEHLLRNAVAHGIEDPADRAAAGKPAVGTITLSLHQQSNDVTVAFHDDGAGLDLARIREKARVRYPNADLDSLTESELANLIFDSGFTTSSKVTELAGRGIGLDVVSTEINALGGRIETSTERGQGTTFKLILPLTTAVTQVVMLRMGELVIGVPVTLVEMVRRVLAVDLALAYQNNVFEFDGELVPFFWAGALLQASASSSETATKTLPVAIFRSAGQRVALHVDEVLGNQEVVVKNLGPQLSCLPGLVGMSALASGAAAMIYNPVALTTVYGHQARQLRLNAEQPLGTAASGAVNPLSNLMAGVSQAPLVLVVDDSITVRRVTQRLLKREGFRVALAADGLQALERLQEEKPAVVLSDIEMPRMDGFDLARNIRGDAKLRDLPIIMITSRIAEKHREHARELGVDHYLGKPFSEEALIGLVRLYCVVPEHPADVNG